MNALKNLSIILVVFLLAACLPLGKRVSPTPTIASPSTIPPTKSPSASPTSIPPTKIPTFTPRPPAPTLSPQEVAGSILTELSIDETHAYSPNGMCEWKRILANPVTQSASNKYEGQFFTNVTISCANQEPWVLVNKWIEGGLGYPLTSLLGWSADGKTAYFYDEIIPDGCQPPGGFQQDLRQVDLATGKTQSIPLTWTGGMALSPDTTRLIYYDSESAEVGIYDLSSGDELRIPMEIPTSEQGWFAGDFTWSPDGKQAVFIVQYGDACSPSGVSLQRVDLDGNPSHPTTGKVTTLLEKEHEPVSIIEWKEPSRILISMLTDKWWLDPTTGKVTILENQP